MAYAVCLDCIRPTCISPISAYWIECSRYVLFLRVCVHRKCRDNVRSWGNKTTNDIRLSVALARAYEVDTSVFCTLNIGLTCSRWVALVNGAWTWLTASIRALAVFAICSISTLYSSRLCFSLATPVSNSSTHSSAYSARLVQCTSYVWSIHHE